MDLMNPPTGIAWGLFLFTVAYFGAAAITVSGIAFLNRKRPAANIAKISAIVSLLAGALWVLSSLAARRFLSVDTVVLVFSFAGIASGAVAAAFVFGSVALLKRGIARWTISAGRLS